MTIRDKIDYLKSNDVKVTYRTPKDEVNKLYEEHKKEDAIKEEIKPSLTVRMIYINKAGKSIIDIPESQVEAHLKAGWKHG